MPKAAKTDRDLAAKVRRCLRAKELGQKHYKRADALLDEISKEVEVGQAIPLNDTGKKAVLKDQFAEKSIVWKPCGVRRYELDVIEG